MEKEEREQSRTLKRRKMRKEFKRREREDPSVTDGRKERMMCGLERGEKGSKQEMGFGTSREK